LFLSLPVFVLSGKWIGPERSRWRCMRADESYPLHAWFTEGFDTADLIEVKALLEELGS